jgi:phenylpropionate dioxygenase-like ring-hydroxylating dioxygenase large terminal subunit
MEDEMKATIKIRSVPSTLSTEEIRDDFVPKDVYFSKDFERLEAEHLWPYVWQVACRLEEIPKVGDYVTYDILDDSIIVVRASEDTVKAYHNVCTHRGMRLTQGSGSAQKFVCRFHGWHYNLEGESIRVVDRQDWGDLLKDEDIKLKPVKTETWGGFVFINMDLDCEPLAKFLDPVDDYCGKFEFEKLRYRWYKTVIMPANWKLVLEFFNEFYHVQQAHPQLLPFNNDYSKSDGFGKHGAIWYAADGLDVFKRSPRLPPKEEPDFRNTVINFVETFDRDLKAMVTERNVVATQRLRTEVSASASREEVVGKWVQFQMEAAAEDGSGWPMQLTPEYIDRSKYDWHVFPNLIYLHATVDGVLCYRIRPNGHDPESCIFDIWSLQRYGPGKAPPLEREFYTDWQDADFPLIFRQDFANIPEVYKGMKSRGFTGARTNPLQERVMTNFHRHLREFIADAQKSQA